MLGELQPQLEPGIERPQHLRRRLGNLGTDGVTRKHENLDGNLLRRQVNRGRYETAPSGVSFVFASTRSW